MRNMCTVIQGMEKVPYPALVPLLVISSPSNLMLCPKQQKCKVAQ